MTQTVTALYDTYDSAVSAVNALEASGIPDSDISRFGAKPDKKIVDRQAASPSSWKTPFMAAWMAS